MKVQSCWAVLSSQIWWGTNFCSHSFQKASGKRASVLWKVCLRVFVKVEGSPPVGVIPLEKWGCFASPSAELVQAVLIGLHRWPGSRRQGFWVFQSLVIRSPEPLLCTRLRLTWCSCGALSFELPQSPKATISGSNGPGLVSQPQLPFLTPSCLLVPPSPSSACSVPSGFLESGHSLCLQTLQILTCARTLQKSGESIVWLPCFAPWFVYYI